MVKPAIKLVNVSNVVTTKTSLEQKEEKKKMSFTLSFYDEPQT